MYRCDRKTKRNEKKTKTKQEIETKDSEFTA